MKPRQFSIIAALLPAVLTIVALTVGQRAWAQTFTIQPTYNSSTHTTTFTITRSGSSLPQQTINYRTVNLSAYAGQHYTAVNDTYTFPANETTTTVEVEEKTASADDAYQFQNGDTRWYRFEVLDVNGFGLAHNDRSITNGTSVPSSGLFNEKEITIYTDEAQYSDAGYDKSPNPHYINSSSYYNLSGIAPKAYYTLIGAELRSTLSFDAKEKANGYQYVQILINNTSSCDNRNDCSDGNPGNIRISRYMAGFDHQPGSTNTTYAAYTFPVTSQPDNNSNPVDNAWNNGVTNKLYKQKFNTDCRATDGRLILPLNFTSLVVRFNASGGGLNDNDEWLAKNVKAHIQAVDATKPTLLNSSTDDITVSAGPYNRGNTFYISVPFSEIVAISGSTKKLSTEWGDAVYESGSGTNVLTFKGTINVAAGTTLKINSLTGTVSDLSGNSFSGSISKTFGAISADPTYSITYDLAGGTLTTANPSTYSYTSSSFTLNNPTKAGYIFEGWTGSNGTTPSKTVTIANHSHGDKSYTANWSVPYIDADGNEQMCSNYTHLESSTGSTVTLGTSGTESWYVVNGNVNITYANDCVLKFNGAVHLILMDGATLTVEGQFPISTSSSLTIYGQSLGTGRLVANGSGTAINVLNSNTAIVNDCTLTINGGNIIATTSGGNAIRVNNTITINGGNVTASSSYTYGDGITSLHGDITINGGIVNATGSDHSRGIKADGTLTLGWRNATDRITASSFYSQSDNIVVKSGQVLSDGTAAYAGTLTTEQRNALKTTKTLQPCFSLTLPEHVDASGTGVFNLSSCYAIAGATVTLTPTGYLLGSASYNDGTAHNVAGNTFTMPAADVTVSASLTPITYSVHFDANGGTGSMDDQSFTYDAAQNLTANAFTPLLGYKFSRWTTNADGTGDSYTNAANVSNLTAVDGATVTLYAQWNICDWLDENEGTVGDPYMIYLREQLDQLATRVNNGKSYIGYHFKLGADIDYQPTTAWDDATSTENNFTAIGSYSHPFCGNFDGDGHTISGIRIYQPNEQYQSLFGYVSVGTVKNVTLTDARITGDKQVGGIAGYTIGGSMKIENCHILNSAITANDEGGVLVGYREDGTYSHNFYRNCIVKVGSNTYTTNIGLGYPRGDYAGEVGSVHALTLPTGVTASGESVVIDGITYYANKNTVTLTYSDPVPDGKTVVFICTYSNGDVIQTFNTFEMPAADVTVSVVMSEPYTLTLSDNISATGITTTIGGTEYFLSGTIVTLGYTLADGYIFNGYIVNGTAIDGNTFTMPAADVAVSAATTDLWGIADDADGSEAHPYIITTAAGLDLLATNVNSGINEYGGKYFKLGADIDYQPTTAWDDATSTEDNYTAIGNEGKAFCGIFDGDGHTVSGIRIYQPNEEYQGLFGRVWAGVVKNVIVSDARINGEQYVGGIAGQINGIQTTNVPIIQDCIVLNTAITAEGYRGVIGIKSSFGTFISNYYHGCTMNGTANATNVGCGFGDINGVRSVHSLILPANVTATGETVTIGTDTYYASNTTVTLAYGGSVPEGYQANYSYNDGSDHAVTGNTFTMPAKDDVTVSTSFGVIPWSGNGTEDDPYIILYPSQLDLLATNVNSGNEYDGEYFKLGNDIDYQPTTAWDDAESTENNYTAIGNYEHAFCGTFDGDGHIVSGIRIYQPNVNYQGLFGRLWGGGTVKNVTVSEARIKGKHYVGGISGHTSGSTTDGYPTIENCLVLNAAIMAQSRGGVLVGYKFDGTYRHNFYRNCTVKVGSNTYTTDIGYGDPIGDYAGEVGSVHAITLPADVTASGESVEIDGITYYANKNTITLSCSNIPTAQTAIYSYNDGSDHALTGNTFTMPASDATVSVSFTAAWSGSGTFGSPYLITTTDQLDLLAKMVNGTDGYTENDFSGTYFKLDNDITYSHTTDWNDATSTENNYTAIGGQDHVFLGFFDGDDHTISGIRIYKDGSDYNVDGNQGLFGKTWDGSVKNVTLSDARITGYGYVGGIIGFNNYGQIMNCHVTNTVAIHAVVNNSRLHGGIVGYSIPNGSSKIINCTSAATISIADGLTDCNDYGGIVGENVRGQIENCLAIGANVSGNSNVAAIVGCDNNGTYTSNYYHGCTVNGTANATNVGSGSGDIDGARNVHSLTLGTDITTTATAAVSYNNTDYYIAGTTVTLAYSGTVPDGCVVVYSYNDGSDHAVTGNTFTMPASDVTVSATLAVPYIDAQGVEQMCSDFTVLTSSDDSQELGDNDNEAWYVVCGDVTIEGELHFKDNAAHLILCDGATLTVNAGDSNGISTNIKITIYGQSGGTGIVNATGNSYAIFASGSITINGGTVNATGNSHGISSGSITINDGTVDATGNNNGISAGGSITINGGIVSATGNNYGISASGDITISGGIVSATGSKGIYASDNSSGTFAIILGWTHASDRIYVSSYSTYHPHAKVFVKDFLTDGTDIYSGPITTGNFNDAVAGKTLMGVDVLYNNNNNTIASLDGKETNIFLSGRTLYKDGKWNTLCLPFDLTLSGSVLDGADARALSSASLSNGTLTLNFSTPVDELTAGTPYIIKWAGDGTNNLVNPAFTNVTVSTATHDFTSGNVTFKGTYSPVTFDAGDKSVLFMGGNNNLYYPASDITMGAFRAYFQLNLDDGSGIKEFRLNFGEDDADGIRTIDNGQWTIDNEGADWYDLSGRKLDNSKLKTQNSKLPSGIYIHNGRKVMVK